MAQTTSGGKGSAASARDAAARQAQVDEIENMATDDDALEGDETNGDDEDVLAEDEIVDEAVSGGSERAVSRASSQATAERTGAPAWIMGNPFTRYIYESYVELRKVTWPTRQQTWQLTLVVIAMSAFVAVLLGLFDLGLTKLIGYLVTLPR
ncbi:MAG TPA: preprotein translocase subunit SecE [Ktedonobacterales bacterium]